MTEKERTLEVFGVHPQLRQENLHHLHVYQPCIQANYKNLTIALLVPILENTGDRKHCPIFLKRPQIRMILKKNNPSVPS